jgi:hypothetical protein
MMMMMMMMMIIIIIIINQILCVPVQVVGSEYKSLARKHEGIRRRRGAQPHIAEFNKGRMLKQ